MRLVMISICGAALAGSLSGCATTDGYASACERDYARNRAAATAAGALIGGAAGAAIAKDDAAGAAIGAAAGGLIANQLAKRMTLVATASAATPSIRATVIGINGAVAGAVEDGHLVGALLTVQ